MALRSELQSMASAACSCNWGIITDLARATWYRWGRMDTCLVTRMFELSADVQGRNYNYCCPRQKKVRAARWRLVIQCWLMRCDSESDSTVITEQVCFLHNKSFTLISSELLLSPNILKNVFFLINREKEDRIQKIISFHFVFEEWLFGQCIKEMLTPAELYSGVEESASRRNKGNRKARMGNLQFIQESKPGNESKYSY